jgi:SET domain
MFCSKSCEKNAFDGFHKSTCKTLNERDHFTNATFETTARLISDLQNISSDDLRSLLYPNDKPSTLFDFDFCQQNEKNLSFNHLKVLNGLVYHQEHVDTKHFMVDSTMGAFFFEGIDRDRRKVLTDIITKLFLVSEQNGIAISSSYSKVRGLHMFGSYLNHSCIPNTGYTYYGNKLVVFVVKPIAKGEQIFTNYT